MRRSVHIKEIIGSVVLGGGLLLLPLALIQTEGPARAVAPAPSAADAAPAANAAATASAALAGGGNGGNGAPEASEAPKEPEASYVGSAACKVCHSGIHTAEIVSAHGKALSREDLPPELKNCEACHGPGSLHAKTAGRTRLVIPSAKDPKTANAVCGTCHFQSDTSKAPKEWQTISNKNFSRSMHGRKGLACVSCHTGHPNGKDKQLIKPAPELCLQCHGDVLESAPGKKAAYTHSPVAEGQCLTCHDPHGTPDHSQVVPNIQKACLECHDASDAKLVEAHKGYPVENSNCASCHDPHSHNSGSGLLRAKQHMPFKQGKCETCHTKPVAGQPIGLVKPAKELCITCHSPTKLMPIGEHAHLPAKDGLCLSCHNPHASSQPALIKARLSNTCFSCHNKIEDASTAEHRHMVFDENLNCVSCHKPHSSPQDHLLIKDEITMCGQCHKHSFSHPIGKKADGSLVLNPTNGDPLVCSSCHSMHGSKFEALTVADKSRDLCLMCHTELEH